MSSRSPLYLSATIAAVVAATILVLVEPATTGAARPLVTPVVGSEPAPPAIDVDRLDRALRERPGAITLAFAGDVHFEGFLEQTVLTSPTTALDPIAPVLSRADLAVVNLETTITDRGEPGPKEYTFRGPPEGLTALAAAGVDVVSVANNHAVDYGPESLVDTLAAVDEAGLVAVGGGLDRDSAYAPYRTTIDGVDVAIIAATDVLDAYALDSWVAGDGPGIASAKVPYRSWLVGAVAAAADTADIVAVHLHWGVERDRCPTADQQELADRLVAAGADIVVGGHAHRLQGGGWKGDAVVHYGLGNFVFYAGLESGVLEVIVTENGPVAYEWVPAQLRGGIATPVEADDWDELRECTDLLP